MAKRKDTKPQVGETVYLRNDPKCTAMYLDNIRWEEQVEYARCHWTSYEFVDDELIGQEHEKEFLLAELTIIPPVAHGKK